MDQPERLPIALVGLMGAGKSAVARALGRRLGAPVRDVDEILAEEAGMSIESLFERRGEPEFRRREAELLARAAGEGPGVIACGGGAVLDPGSRALLRRACRTVWLEVTPAEAARRVGGGGGRPLLAGAAAEPRLAALLAEREPLYAEVAARRVATDGRDVEAVAAAVLDALDGGTE